MKRVIKKCMRLFQKRNSSSTAQPFNTILDRYRTVDLVLYHISICRRDPASGKDLQNFGNYAEFGVFKGDMFAHVCNRGAQVVPGMRYFAFDSFQGLPEPTGIDVGGEFAAGQFCFSQEDFTRRLERTSVNMQTINIVPGWFSDTLSDSELNHGLSDVSFAYIDCDLYESTVPVLNFLTNKISQGTVLLFDDWYCFRADPSKGVQKATSEWLARNPDINLISWRSFSHHGQAFFVNKV